jgi:hypothetical protein
MMRPTMKIMMASDADLLKNTAAMSDVQNER